MLVSLSIATDGLLEQGSKPALAIATRGLILFLEVSGGDASSWTGEDLILKDDQEVLELIIIITQSGVLD